MTDEITKVIVMAGIAVVVILMGLASTSKWRRNKK